MSSNKETHYNRPEGSDEGKSGGRTRKPLSADRAKDKTKRSAKESGREEAPRSERPAREKQFRERSNDREKPAFRKREDGDRPFREKRNDGDKPAFRKREDGDRPYRSKDNQDDKPFRKREEGDRPYRAKSNSDDKPFRKREEGDRPYRAKSNSDDKPFRKREEGDRSYRAKNNPDDKPFRKREDGDRPYRAKSNSDDKPFHKRDEGDRPYKGKSNPDEKPPFRKREEGDRPFREKRSNDDRPSFRGKTGDREERGNYPKPDREDRPKRPRREDGDRSFSKERRSAPSAGDDGLKKYVPFEQREGEQEEEPKRRFDREDKGDRKPSFKGRLDAGRIKRDDSRDEESKKPENPFEGEDFYEDEHPFTRSNKWDERSKAGPMTLNKYLAHSGISSRRDAAAIVKEGKVKVNGTVVLDPGYRVKENDTISHDGKIMTPQRHLVYILLNKPKGFITTTEDEKGRRTVMDLVANAGVDRLYPVGRLDRATTGVLLITNDGDLAQKLSHPSYNSRKIYQVTLTEPLTKRDFDYIVAGSVTLEDGLAPVDALAYLEKKNEIGIEIHSGKNRIVRRIFESLGYVVEKLDRVVYAGLTKKNVSRGKWRFLTEKEIIRLKHFKG